MDLRVSQREVLGQTAKRKGPNDSEAAGRIARAAPRDYFYASQAVILLFRSLFWTLGRLQVRA